MGGSGPIEKLDATAGAVELLEEDHLVDVVPGEPIWGGQVWGGQVWGGQEHQVAPCRRYGIAQGIEPWSL
jgi:hypothetical protein